MQRLASICATCIAASPVRAQLSGDAVRFGILMDMNGPSADGSEKGSVVAVQLAIDDFDGKVLGKPTSEATSGGRNKWF